MSVRELQHYLDCRDIEKALRMEALLYETMVKPVEDEDHYYQCFRQWVPAFEEFATRYEWLPASGKKVGFVVHSDAPMAHAKALLKTCELRPKGIDCAVFVLAPDTGNLRREFAPHTKVFYLGRGDGIENQFIRLRNLLRAFDYGTLVWVSLPIWSVYAFSTRLANKQVFWSQRFHPVISKNIDLYICPGKRSETTRTYHGQEWKVAHTPLCIDVAGVSDGTCPPLSPYRHKYGTVGRTEKIAVGAFQKAVRAILRGVEGSGFIYTGRTKTDVDQPSQYVGWVDPAKYIPQLDVYLETFPLGGLCTITAWELGVPVVALDNQHSPYGSVEHDGLLSANSPDAYVEMAIRAIEPKTRGLVIEAQRQVLAQEVRQARSDVEHFWSLIGSA